MEKVIRYGIEFYREGNCKRCGACEKKHCPHFSMKNGLSTCATYGSGDYLKKKCNLFPGTPFAGVVSKGICGFSFVPVAEEDKRKYSILLESIARSKEEYGNRSKGFSK